MDSEGTQARRRRTLSPTISTYRYPQICEVDRIGRKATAGSFWVTDVFISYAREMASSARKAAEALQSAGFSVWIDDHLPAHGDFPTAIEERLRAAKAVLVLWSADAVASRWVPAEADVAHKAGTLIQLTLDGSTPPLPFNRLQCIRLPGWRGDLSEPGWLKVAGGIADLVGRRAASVPSPVPAPEPRERLLAVLAFDNLSGDSELSYFSDGVSEEIQQTVAQNSDLRVVARSSSFQFRGADKAVRKVASDLKATHLLDGSVRRSGERVRISAQFVQCAGELTLWANRFDGDLTDVFALQERIAQAIAEALKVTLAPPAQAAPIAPRVYEDFLKARAMITEGSRLFDAAAAEATPLLAGVTAAAPEYAPAWELLAGARAWTLRSGHRKEPYATARAGVVHAAEAALRLDPKRGGAYAALAMLEPWAAYGAREALLKRALEMSPHDPGLLTEMSTFYWSVGRFGDALRLAEEACELNPLMPAARLNFAQMRAYVGDYESSVRLQLEIHRRWPRNVAILASLLNFAASLGFPDAYEEALEAARTLGGPQAIYIRSAVTYSEAIRSNDPERRRELLAHYEARLQKTGTLPLNFIEGVSQMGLVEEALDLAERASFAHTFDPDGPLPSGNYPGVIMGPWSAMLKSPRFIDLCDRLGLCAYWAQSERWPDCVNSAPYDFKNLARGRAAA
jgi:TolB-like protein